MEKRDIKSRVKELVELIERYQFSYYNGEAEISDAEFDELWDELAHMDPDNPILHKVGSDSGNFKKVQHLMMMGSQQKANEPEEFDEWWEKVKPIDLIAEYKMDGASIELQYENGKFICGVTRGDGKVGDDITKNVSQMKGSVKNIDSGFSGSVRGEVVMSHQTYQMHFSDKANCRNAANGIMKRLDGKGSEYLNIIVYDVVCTNQKDLFNTERDKLEWLKTQGFDVVPAFYPCTSPHFLRQQINYRDRAKYDYDIDGIVFKDNNFDPEDLLRDRPSRQIAYKFDLESACTILRDVIWSRNGQTYTPVASFDMVKLCGTNVSHASFANYGKFMQMHPHKNDAVKVVKRGEIIPKIDEIYHKDNPTSEEFKAPECCYLCGTPLTVVNDVMLTCKNPVCIGLNEHRLQKFTNITSMMGFGPSIVADFMSMGINTISEMLVTTVEDLITMANLWLPVSGFGEGTAKKLVREIDRVRNQGITPTEFVAGFDIPGVGIEKSDEFIKKFKPKDGKDLLRIIRDLKSGKIRPGGAHEEAISQIPDIVLDDMEKCLEVMKLLVGEDFNQLSGLEFVFSGSFNKINREIAGKLVSKYGAKFGSNVTKKTSYLVCNEDSGSSKYKRAQSLGVKIINEDEFLKILNDVGISY